jgi:hypothetical protein
VRYHCKAEACGVTFAIIPVRPLGAMRLDPAKATLCLSLLTEGCSIRSTERVSGVHCDTITRLLLVAGRKAAALLDALVSKVEVKDVQGDKIWSFTKMKEKTKVRKGIADHRIGDAYTFVAIERSTKNRAGAPPGPPHAGRRPAVLGQAGRRHVGPLPALDRCVRRLHGHGADAVRLAR